MTVQEIKSDRTENVIKTQFVKISFERTTHRGTTEERDIIPS